ncbi:NUDIX hydrolase [Actinomadura chibensis]|nr:NUDIX hydrolase [Actinomadura chibensis]
MSRRTVFEKHGRGIDQVVFEMPDGRTEEFYIKSGRATAAVVALTAEHRVIVARQFRPGPQEFLYELPGGFVGPGEDPRHAVERELLEETGYRGDVSFVARCHVDAYSSVARHCFVATNCVKIAEPALEDNEYVEVGLHSVTSFRQLLRNGRMSDSEAGYLGLDHLGLL